MNKTIRNDVRELILNLVCIDLNRLSPHSQAEVRRVGQMERGGEDDLDGIPALSLGTSASVHPMQQLREIGAQQQSCCPRIQITAGQIMSFIQNQI